MTLAVSGCERIDSQRLRSLLGVELGARVLPDGAVPPTAVIVARVSCSADSVMLSVMSGNQAPIERSLSLDGVDPERVTALTLAELVADLEAGTADSLREHGPVPAFDLPE